MTKYIFITGGVVSSLGKGIASASLASILENRGLNVTLLKLDPYINVDGEHKLSSYHIDNGIKLLQKVWLVTLTSIILGVVVF